MAQLTFYERQQIESFNRCHHSFRLIGRKLNRNHSIISREIKRNSSPHLRYTAFAAQRAFELRKRLKHKRKLEKAVNSDLRNFVVACIKDDWSPDQIAGRIKSLSLFSHGKTISKDENFLGSRAGIPFGKLRGDFSSMSSHNKKKSPS